MAPVFEYGATGQKAGTLVRVSTPDKPAKASPFGVALHAGAYPRGFARDAGGNARVMGPLTRETADRLLGISDLFGGFPADLQATLAAGHFFKKGEGAGQLYAIRITDGNERVAAIPIFDRDVDTSYWAARVAAKIAAQVGVLKASNGGRWAGMATTYGNKVADVAAAISGPTFDTGLGSAFQFAQNELAGMTFSLVGSGRTWTVASNTAVGVIVVKGDFVGVSTGACTGFWSVRAENLDAAGNPRSLGVIVRDGTTDPNGQFRLTALENRRVVRTNLDNLVMDPAALATAGTFWPHAVATSLEQSQWELDATDSEDAQDPSHEEHKPANFAEICMPGGLTANTVKFRLMNFLRTGTGNGTVGSMTTGGAMVPHRYVLTFTDATHCTVAVYDISGTRLLAGGLPNVTLGSAYAAAFTFLAGFTVTAGTTPHIVGDVITIYVRPLPVSAAGTGTLQKLGAWFYPAAFAGTGPGSQDVTKRYRVMSNTFDTVTLGPLDDVSAMVVPPGLPYLTGTSAWDTTKATTGVTFIYQLQNASAVTVTATGSATQTIEDFCADFNGQVGAGAGKVVATVVTAGGHKYLKITADDAYYGPAATLKATTGTLNAVAGYTDNTTATGATPTVGRLEYLQEFESGRDGVSNLANTHYASIWDTSTSPALALKAMDVGCIEMAQPGQTDPLAQQALLDLAPVIGFMARIEIPSTVVDVSGAAVRTWLRANITPNDFFRCCYPSFGYLAANPTGAAAPYLCTYTGARQGIRAKVTEKNKGPHIADSRDATQNATMSPLFASQQTDQANGQGRELNEDLLNGIGVEVIRHQPGSPTIYVWGARIPGANWQYGYGHKVEVLLDIKQAFLIAGDPIAFSALGGPVGKQTRLQAVATGKGIMRSRFDAGWFKGGSFETAVDITCDDSNNPPEVEGAGRLVTSVGAEIIDSAEKVEWNIGSKGVATSGGTR